MKPDETTPVILSAVRPPSGPDPEGPPAPAHTVARVRDGGRGGGKFAPRPQLGPYGPLMAGSRAARAVMSQLADAEGADEVAGRASTATSSALPVRHTDAAPVASTCGVGYP